MVITYVIPKFGLAIAMLVGALKGAITGAISGAISGAQAGQLNMQRIQVDIVS